MITNQTATLFDDIIDELKTLKDKVLRNTEQSEKIKSEIIASRKADFEKQKLKLDRFRV